MWQVRHVLSNYFDLLLLLDIQEDDELGDNEMKETDDWSDGNGEDDVRIKEHPAIGEQL